MSRSDEDVERRLDNWARWYWSDGLRGSRSGGRVSPIYANGPRGRRSDATMPLLDGEAIETDSAVHRLNEKYTIALRARYLRIGPGGIWFGTTSTDRVARILGVCERTYHHRISDGKFRLMAEIAAKRAAIRERRA